MPNTRGRMSCQNFPVNVRSDAAGHNPHLFMLAKSKKRTRPDEMMREVAGAFARIAEFNAR